jgi:hypothetical protein
MMDEDGMVGEAPQRLFNEREVRLLTRATTTPPGASGLLAVARMRRAGEDQACSDTCCSDADEGFADYLLSVCYQMLATAELSTWHLLMRWQQQQQRTAGEGVGTAGRAAWMRSVLEWLQEGAAEIPPAPWAGHAHPPSWAPALDPDAASRGAAGRRGEPDAVLLQQLWAHIRSGHVQQAQDCCRAARQWWRAASLTPAGPSAAGGGGGGGGSAGRRSSAAAAAAWRRACLSVAKDPTASGFERAVYAVISAHSGALDAFGDAKSGMNTAAGGGGAIDGVLTSWQDKLFVWVKVWVGQYAATAATSSDSSVMSSEDGDDDDEVSMQKSLSEFLSACSAKTEEDLLAEKLAKTVDAQHAVTVQ